jgi:hypothetical protein
MAYRARFTMATRPEGALLAQPFKPVVRFIEVERTDDGLIQELKNATSVAAITQELSAHGAGGICAQRHPGCFG